MTRESPPVVDETKQPSVAHTTVTTALGAYQVQVADLARQLAALAPGAPVRLAKKTSNLFRSRTRTSTPGLDVGAFGGVLAIDVAARTADVGGMTTYEHLVDATLPFGLMPPVVPQLKTITLGGAVSGLGIESSSFRNGLVHESVLEMDILTGDGTVVTARPDNEHRALFFGFPNSYGTLGYVLRVKIALEPVAPFVHLRHLRFGTIHELVQVLESVCAAGHHHDEAVAFVDGTVFGPDECYLTLGSWAETASRLSDYTRTEIYYRSLQQHDEDWLSVRDYLWRWDTDWFWCSRAFGVQRRWVRRLLGPRLLRSSVYWKIAAFEQRHHVKAAIDRRRGRPERESVIQDIEVPLARLAEFVAGFEREVPISPIWLCPLRQRDPSVAWELYRLDPSELYVNVGFWSTVALADGMDPTHHNRWVEDEVQRLGGRKSLYSTAFYDEGTFWALYNGPVYRDLKARYDPSDRLLDLYAKCVQAR
ncbi:MAG: FAD-binding oxidoreductase [Actinomycetota bacterium]|nr:FAD-binding oxidoreductase [Actinomycetota bacterium]